MSLEYPEIFYPPKFCKSKLRRINYKKRPIDGLSSYMIFMERVARFTGFANGVSLTFGKFVNQ